MKTSKGRDKICGIIQYLSDFYSTCTKYSNIEQIKDLYNNNLILSAIVASKIKSSMSQSRKVFRFLKFFEEMNHIEKIFKTKKRLFLKIIIIISHLMSFFYYIHDNILWFINIGILSDVISEKNQIIWKTRKNSFSLIKNFINISKSVLFLILRKRKENKMLKILHNCKKNPISKENDTYDVCLAVLRQRKKRRLANLEVFLSLLRCIQLIKSLKITSVKLNHIFVSFCGLISSFISLFKLLGKQSKDKHTKKEISELSTEVSQEDLRNKLASSGKRKYLSASSLIKKESESFCE